MPKVRRSPNLEKDDLARAYIAKGMARERIGYETLGTKMKSTRQTQKNKYDKPGTYTLAELRELQKILKLSDVEFTSMILGTEVMQVVRA